jgi:nitroreductase
MGLFRSRRSTRNYRDAPIEKEKLERIVQAGRFAPTGGNVQPVHFIVVHTKTEFDRIRDLTIDVLVDQTRKIEDAVRRHEETGEPLSAVYQFRKKHITRFKEMPRLLKQGVDRLFFGASALVACHVDPTKSTASGIDASLAAMQMVLMSETLGLGSCFIGAFVYAVDESPELKKILGIPDAHRATIAFVLGYPDVTFSRLVAREPARVKWL